MDMFTLVCRIYVLVTGIHTSENPTVLFEMKASPITRFSLSLCTGPGDYVMHTQTLTFNAMQSEFSVPIMIVNDDILEQTEFFVVQAQLVSTDTIGVFIDPEQSQVTIEDDERKLNSLTKEHTTGPTVIPFHVNLINVQYRCQK